MTGRAEETGPATQVQGETPGPSAHLTSSLTIDRLCRQALDRPRPLAGCLECVGLRSGRIADSADNFDLNKAERPSSPRRPTLTVQTSTRPLPPSRTTTTCVALAQMSLTAQHGHQVEEVERQKVHERHVHRASVLVSTALTSQTRSCTSSRVRDRDSSSRSDLAQSRTRSTTRPSIRTTSCRRRRSTRFARARSPIADIAQTHGSTKSDIAGSSLPLRAPADHTGFNSIATKHKDETHDHGTERRIVDKGETVDERVQQSVRAA